MASESLYMRERGGLIVVGLEGVAVTLAGAIVVNIGHESVVIAVEVELGNLVLHAERLAQFGNKTIGGSVVVGTELYAVAVTAFQRELVISVLHTRLFVERSGEGSVDGSTGSFGHLHIFAEGESNGLSLSSVHCMAMSEGKRTLVPSWAIAQLRFFPASMLTISFPSGEFS